MKKIKCGQPVYNTEQRRQILRQMKQYFDKEWLKRRAAGRLSKDRIILPNTKPEKRIRRRANPLRLYKIKTINRYTLENENNTIKLKKRNRRKRTKKRKR